MSSFQIAECDECGETIAFDPEYYEEGFLDWDSFVCGACMDAADVAAYDAAGDW